MLNTKYTLIQNTSDAALHHKPDAAAVVSPSGFSFTTGVGPVPQGALPLISTFLFGALPVPVSLAAGSTISLTSILTKEFGAGLGGFQNVFLTYAGAATLTANNFNYWDPSNPSVSKWLMNGVAIASDTQIVVSAANIPEVTFQAGNAIGPFVNLTVQVGASEFIQFDVETIDPTLMHLPANHAEPTVNQLLASASRYAAKYTGVLNNNDCHFISDAIASAVGATMSVNNTQSLDPSQNVESGFWRIAYRGSVANPVADWHTLVKPGDIVRMGWDAAVGGGQHTTLVLGVNPDGSLHVLDNADAILINNVPTDSIGVHDAFYDQQTIPSTVTIYRLTTDHLYLINGTAADETLSGTVYADKIMAAGGNDTVSGGIGNDVLSGGVGDDVLAGGVGADRLIGGAGSDTFAYTSTTESNAVHFDKIADFDALTDKFDFATAVTGVNKQIAVTLDTATLNTDLKADLGKTVLKADHAILVVANGGDLTGHTFLVVEAAGHAGYKAGDDYVIDVTGATNLVHLTVADFI
jgi:Ca2+-binding RTX toxin-like protein